MARIYALMGRIASGIRSPGARYRGKILAEAAGAFGGAQGGVVVGIQAFAEEGVPVVNALARRREVGAEDSARREFRCQLRARHVPGTCLAPRGNP